MFILRVKFPAVIMFFLFFGGLTLKAQDISGKWEGYLDQTNGALGRRSYQALFDNKLFIPHTASHRLTLDLAKENRGITGYYRVSFVRDTSVRAVFRLKGTFHEGEQELAYHTTSKEAEYTNGLSIIFCNNKAKLHYYVKDSIEYLEGDWKGWADPFIPCAESYILLCRKLKKPVHPDTLKPVTNPIQPERKNPGRLTELNITRQFSVTASQLKIALTDANVEDGDTVSILLNKEWVARNVRLTKRKKEFIVQLKPGENILEMLAENQGSIPPNTAEMIVWTGDQKHKVLMESDLKKSAAIRVLYAP